MLDGYLEVYEGLCSVKKVRNSSSFIFFFSFIAISMIDYLVTVSHTRFDQVDLSGQIFTGSSVRKVLVREAKSHAAVALVVGTCKQRALG